MKRIITFILALLLLAVGCSSSNDVRTATDGGDLFDAIAEGNPVPTAIMDVPASTSITVTERPATTVPTFTPKPMPTETPKLANGEDAIKWTTIQFSTTDSDGYTYDIICKFSPWILLSNTTIIEKAWKEVSGGKTLPLFNDWNVEDNGLGQKRITGRWYSGWSSEQFFYNCSNGITDMYYSVGSVSVTNTTYGWPITSSNKREIVIPIRCGPDRKNKPSDIAGFTAGKVFYRNGDKTFLGGVKINPLMEKDTWGPVTVIMMTAEVFSPAYPDGGYYDYVLNHLVIGGSDEGETPLIPQTRLGIIGKDQKYTISNHDQD